MAKRLATANSVGVAQSTPPSSVGASVEVLLRVNGRTLARAQVDRRGERITGRVGHPARGTNTLDVVASRGTLLRYLRLRHEGWRVGTP